MTNDFTGHTDLEQQPSIDIFCDCTLGTLCAIFVLEVWLSNAANWNAERRGLSPSDPSPVLVPLLILTLLAAALWVVRKIVLRRKIVVTDV